MCGQDISDRAEQFRAVRQFTMAKSRDTYAPTGPVLVTPDELPDRDNVAVRCSVDGEEVQNRPDERPHLPRTGANRVHLLVVHARAGRSHLHGHAVGRRRQPRSRPRYLSPGNVVETEIDDIGMFVTPASRLARTSLRGAPPLEFVLLCPAGLGGPYSKYGYDEMSSVSSKSGRSAIAASRNVRFMSSLRCTGTRS